MKAHVPGSPFSLSKPFLNYVNKHVHVQVLHERQVYILAYEHLSETRRRDIEIEDRHPLLRVKLLDDVCTS
jgi:hypothetical protein